MFFICFYVYISMWYVSMSVIVLARDGNPLRTGAVCSFLMLSFVLASVFCTHALWFLHEKDVPLFMWYECYCYQFFFGKWIMAYWRLWFPLRVFINNEKIDRIHEQEMCFIYSIEKNPIYITLYALCKHTLFSMTIHNHQNKQCKHKSLLKMMFT